MVKEKKEMKEKEDKSSSKKVKEEKKEKKKKIKEKLDKEIGKKAELREEKTKGAEGNKKEQKREFDIESWKPKTSLGKKVKTGEIKDIDYIIDNGLKILEPEIIDVLIPQLEQELLLVGQSKGKFGGGKRRAFRQTQKKTSEGNKIRFASYVIVGNKDGIVGLGYGKAKETVPAREKAIRNAKLNIIKIRRGCGSWECNCKEAHSIPFSVEAKVGSLKIKLIPAPKGTGLCIQEECRKILEYAGIEDVWSRIIGKTSTRANVILACFKALQKLVETKIKKEDYENLGIKETRIKKGTEGQNDRE